MKKLRKIEFSENSIRSVEAFVDLPNVERIGLSSNEIVELPANSFRSCPRLATLQLSSNLIKALRGDEFNQLTGLKELGLSYAKLASIAPTTFHPLTSLESLDLSWSFSGEQKIIGKELFMYSTNLKQLKLTGNKFQAIHPEAFDHLRKLINLKLHDSNCADGGFVILNHKVLIENQCTLKNLKLSIN
jgi:Leucine-rich repeat (LRR) protein